MTEGKKRKFKITQKQLDRIGKFGEIFDYASDRIKELCDTERDDIVYGFELGGLHSALREWYLEVTILEEKIRKQEMKGEDRR